MREKIIIRGAGDIASGVGHRLKRCGFKVIMLERDRPTVIRRTVSFASAVFTGKTEVEGIKGLLVKSIEEAEQMSNTNYIPLLIDPKGQSIGALKPDALVDCILAKKNLGTTLNMAPVVIGAGPGFCAGLDVHAVVETKRGHDLGKVIYSGSAAPDTKVPGSIEGFSFERLVRSPADGVVEVVRDIGHIVKIGDLICRVGEHEVKAAISGMVRGMIQNGELVYKGMKIGDIDPRGMEASCYTISDKARAVAGGVIEALLTILYGGVPID